MIIKKHAVTEMNLGLRSAVVFSAALLFLGAGRASATAWVIGTDLCDGTDCENNVTYSGSYGLNDWGYNTGIIRDGGSDGFDGFGYLNGFADLTVSRQVDVLQSINTYRWVDTFTNTGTADISTNVTFYGDLGSDSATVVDSNGHYSSVSHEFWADYPGVETYDPVFGIVWGNNAWALTNMLFSRSRDNVYSQFSLNLAAGESTSIAHFAALIRPDDDYPYYDPATTIAAVQQCRAVKC